MEVNKEREASGVGRHYAFTQHILSEGQTDFAILNYISLFFFLTTEFTSMQKKSVFSKLLSQSISIT